MTIKHFEEINLDELEDYYSKKIDFDSQTIEVDLNFESVNLNPEQIKKMNFSLTGIKGLIDQSWNWILADYKNGVEVSEYISFHLDDFFEDNPEEILDGTDSTLDNRDRFLQTLKVNRIGIYPSSSENYLIIDWMTNPDLSNYILVVNVNDDLELEYITVES